MTATVEYMKKSITVPVDVMEEASRLLGDNSFSAYVTNALRRQIQNDNLVRLVAELEEDYGPVTDEEYQQALAEMTS